MPESHDSEFYIGYLEESPPRTAAVTRRTARTLLCLAVLVAAVSSVAFQRLSAASFDFLNERSFVGTLVEEPYPALLVRRPGTVQNLPVFSRYHLVGFGKRGATPEVSGWNGKSVELEGLLIHRDGQTMIEVVEGSVRAAAGDALDPGAPEHIGRHRLVGEIVDSKCFLGVMNPGNLKPHRACAARCISGGIPPVLCVRDADGAALYLLLVDTDGSPVNERVLQYVAEPLEVSGEVYRIGEQLVLRADPEEFRRL